MYRLVLNGTVIGNFANVVFTKKSPTSGCFIECNKGEADGIVANGQVYAITNSEDYKDYDQVSVFELDGEIERTAELDYMRIMANLI